jgi:hypothetical protein
LVARLGVPKQNKKKAVLLSFSPKIFSSHSKSPVPNWEGWRRGHRKQAAAEAAAVA